MTKTDNSYTAKVFDRIKGLAKEKGLTPMILADKAGMPRSAMSKLMNGRSNPTLQTMYTIADTLEVSPRELFPIEKTEICGFVEINGSIRKISTMEDIAGIKE